MLARSRSAHTHRRAAPPQVVSEVYALHPVPCEPHVVLSLVLYKMVDPGPEVGAATPLGRPAPLAAVRTGSALQSGRLGTRQPP